MKKLYLNDDLVARLDQLKQRLSHVLPMEDMDKIYAAAACGEACRTTCSQPCAFSCADTCGGTCWQTCSVICDQPFIWHQAP